MKIVVLDGFTENPGDLSWDALGQLGELTVYDRTSYVESPIIVERIGDAEIVVTNKTPISKETIDRCPNMKAIAVLATGYNVIDFKYAKEKGIPVINVPTYGTQIVGQYAVSLLMEICSHIGHHDRTVKEGKWETRPHRKSDSQDPERDGYESSRLRRFPVRGGTETGGICGSRHDLRGV